MRCLIFNYKMAKVRGRREKKTTFKERPAGSEVAESDSEIEVTVPKFEKSEKAASTEFSTVFFGLVDSNEIEYFKQAESTLNVNAFDSDEDRAGFIRSVLEESRGKELKLVTNQICSKLMERLVLFASDRQLKNIFHQFQGHFPALAHHKYSSHVLETLLVRSAALLEKELVNEAKGEDDGEEDTVSSTMESMFLEMTQLLEPYYHSMIEHQYASHVLRVIMLVLSAKELPSTTMANSTLRSKKSKIARKMIEIKDNEDFNREYQVPPSFKEQLKIVLAALTAKLDTQKARELAVHKVASPVIQLCLKLEGIIDRERPLWHLLFLQEKLGADTKEQGFVEYLLSDPVGSHFLESIIKTDSIRLKYVERLYKLYMRDRVLKLAKRATTGVYIIQAFLFTLKPAEVEHILDELIPELSNLISISQNQNIDLGKSIIDASLNRGNYRRDELISQLFLKFAPNYNVEDPSDATTSEFFENVLQLAGSTLGNTRDDWPTAEERRRSLFLEKLMDYDYSFIICAWFNCMALPQERFIQMCLHGVFSHVIEHALVVKPAAEGEPKNIMIMRKKFLNLFQGLIFTLSCNSYGSHIVDKLWDFTIFLPMYKDRIATELRANSQKVKDSTYGRLVWKNWSMELFERKKYDWKTLVKTQEQIYHGELEVAAEPKEKKKTAIQMKMDEIFEKKQRQEEWAKRHGDDLVSVNQKKFKARGRD